jgi:hypothetical protein
MKYVFTISHGADVPHDCWGPAVHHRFKAWYSQGEAMAVEVHTEGGFWVDCAVWKESSRGGCDEVRCMLSPMAAFFNRYNCPQATVIALGFPEVAEYREHSLIERLEEL